MLQKCLMNSCQRKFSMENCRKESAHKVTKRNATKIFFKPRLKISIFQLSPGNGLHRIEQSGVASLTKEVNNLIIFAAERERKERKARAKGPNLHAVFATDSLELILAYTAINEHTITHEHLILRI